jgi:hypothetical protein
MDQLQFEKRTRQEAFDDDDDKKGRRKIKIEYIEDKSRRHITFSKRKAGIMKKAYELSTLTGTQVLLLVASETGHVYTFATPKLQPMITKPEGKDMIQKCLNATDRARTPSYSQYTPAPSPSQPVSAMSIGYSEIESPLQNTETEFQQPSYPIYNSAGLPLSPDQQLLFNNNNNHQQLQHSTNHQQQLQQQQLQHSSLQNSMIHHDPQYKPSGYYDQRQQSEDGLFQQKEMQQGYPYYPVQSNGYFRQPPRTMTPVDMSMTPLEIPHRSLTPGLDIRIPPLGLQLSNDMVSQDIINLEQENRQNKESI